MRITQWLRNRTYEGIRYDTDIGYLVEGDNAEYDEMISWCTEHFGDNRVNHHDDYRWDGHLSGRSISFGGIHGCFRFKNEEDAMAFKLRWL